MKEQWEKESDDSGVLSLGGYTDVGDSNQIRNAKTGAGS